MFRREFVAGVGLVLAGCLGDGGGSNEPAIVGQELQVTSSGCGDSGDAVDVSVSGETVTVDGVIPGRDGCRTASLAGAQYDAGSDELVVTVETVDTGADACIECIVAIEYTATVDFSGGAPGSVTVRHRRLGETVTV